MKKLAVTILLASAFAFAQAQDSSITGKWKIHSSIAGNDSDATCTFAQTGNDLSGTCPRPQGEVKFTGKADGNKLTWSYQMDYNGSPLTMKYEATLDTGKMTGTVTVDPFGVSGDMSGVPATDAAPAATPAAAPATVPSAAPAAAPAAGDTSVNGKWNIHSSIAGNDSDIACTFMQTGNDLAGTCPGPQGEVKFTGKMDGNKVSWSFQVDYNGSPLTMKNEATLDGGKMTGTVTVDPFGVSGDLTATPAK
jgi:autotransporter translocation and assembly factor TamB